MVGNFYISHHRSLMTLLNLMILFVTAVVIAAMVGLAIGVFDPVAVTPVSGQDNTTLAIIGNLTAANVTSGNITAGEVITGGEGGNGSVSGGTT
jgi:hypothetical protein